MSKIKNVSNLGTLAFAARCTITRVTICDGEVSICAQSGTHNTRRQNKQRDATGSQRPQPSKRTVWEKASSESHNYEPRRREYYLRSKENSTKYSTCVKTTHHRARITPTNANQRHCCCCSCCIPMRGPPI
jgi:hypothetical protein